MHSCQECDTISSALSGSMGFMRSATPQLVPRVQGFTKLSTYTKSRP